MARSWIAVLVTLGLSLMATICQAALPEVKPADVAIDPSRLARIDEAVERAIAKKSVPGAVVLVGRHGQLAYARAFGMRAVDRKSEPMTRDTIFDMASLTKPIATATSILILIERGDLRPTDRLGRLLPEFDNHGKGAITLDQLLRHRSGLIADNPESDYADGPEKAWERLAQLDLAGKPGEKFLYSDVNYIILGRIVQKVSGKPLDQFAAEHIFEPLEMNDTRFLPIEGQASLPESLRDRIAPTEPAKGEDAPLRGRVHDPRSRALGGVAGHAGLFSTADDLAVYAQMILNRGFGANGKSILSALGVRLMTTPGDTPPHELRGLGWDIDTGFSAPRGSLYGKQSFGHTGFTGTSIWIDPETDSFVIILTSRLHPDGKKPSPTALRSEVATIAAASILDTAGQMTPPRIQTTQQPTRLSEPVFCGVDVLIERNFDVLRGKRVGLITNHTGRTRDGRATIDVLFHAPEVKLVALFSPEHGIRGAVDRKVDDSKDEATGLPVYSLYGKTQKPLQSQLRDLDVLVYDIQDIGARFYTYISTLGLAMEAAQEQGILFVVLDRPNPIGGVEVSGPVRDDEFASFIAHHALPVRHGMTVGELAMLFNRERDIGAALSVVLCRGWRRDRWYDQTDLVWVNPSPNMRSLTEALLYPGVALLEATNFATGRGTDTPFERVGAPWIKPREFASGLNALNLPGVRFVPIRFTPNERQYANQECGGVQILVTDWSRIDPIDVGFGLAIVLRSQYRDDWKPEGLLKLMADRAAYDALLAGKSLDEIKATWQDELPAFQRVRAQYLLYPRAWNLEMR